jgi:NTP pyrophosphatase (non-canonical NTP hydrolase)
MIRQGTLEKSSLDDWVEEFYDIYKDQDRKRNVSDMWLHLVENASKVGEATRKNEWGEACKELSHVFCWLCGFAAKCKDKDPSNNIDKVFLLNKPLSEIVWEKYPNACWKCGASPCSCSVNRIDIEAKKEKRLEVTRRIAMLRGQKRNMPGPLDQWVDMFTTIYENAHYGYPIEYVCFHFLEEVGEVSRAILALSQLIGKDLNEEETKHALEEERKKLEEELADVFSWIASYVSKLGFISDTVMSYHQAYSGTKGKEEIKLSKIIWKEYKSARDDLMVCPPPYCESRPCKCPVPRSPKYH